MFLMMVILGLIVSLDGLAAALAYGTRRIRLAILAVLLVSMASAMMLWLAMGLGQLICSYLPPVATRYLGTFVLLILGCYMLYQPQRTGRSNQASLPSDKTQQLLAQLRLKAFGLVIQILRDPTLADVDKSGTITWQESVLLGLALSLDSFGVGIGAAMTGLDPLLTAVIVGLITLFSLVIGWEMGYRFQEKMNGQLVRLPGLLLLLMGLVNLLLL